MDRSAEDHLEAMDRSPAEDLQVEAMDRSPVEDLQVEAMDRQSSAEDLLDQSAEDRE